MTALARKVTFEPATGSLRGVETQNLERGDFAALNYRALLGPAEWASLPAATRARFEQHDACYVGAMTLRASAAGRCLALLCRAIGSPLPPHSATPLVATVRVERDAATGGSRWIRSYAYPSRTVSIGSVKALHADGRVVERLAMGLRMGLDVYALDGALHFVSTAYYIECSGFRCFGRRFCAWRLHFPSWFPPGGTHVVHRDLGDGRFRFTMAIRHKLLGELFHHDGVFRSTGGDP
jgi:uncharacterized protein DUF4166